MKQNKIFNLKDAGKIRKKINKKVVFISGVTGQDGSTMTDYLLKNTDYVIFGGVRRLSVYNHNNINHIQSDRFYLVNFDLSDSNVIDLIVSELTPDYFINFAAQSFVGNSWDVPVITWEYNTTSIIYMLEAIRKYSPNCRFYNAGSSEEYGNVSYTPQDENHPYKPRSVYGASKAAGRHIVKVYRESYGLYAIQGLLFNHEGIRRGEDFVTRKITKGVARIKLALEQNKPFESIELGNLYAQRDWSDAEDFVDSIWKMLNQDIYRKTPIQGNLVNNLKEYVVSSDETHTIKEFVELAFKHANINGEWHGNGIHEEFSITKLDADKYNIYNSVLVKINEEFYRPAEVNILMGNSNLIRKELGWKPNTTFEQLVQKMVLNDLKEVGL